MSFVKRNYIDYETVITAENMNDIQNELISQGEQQDATMIENSASGAIASFSDGANLPVSELLVGIEAVQSGSGDPSPENIRPISGWTGANIVVSPTLDAQDGTTYSISWQTEVGTVYGGTLDVTTGVLTINMGYVDLGTLNWTKINTTSPHWRFWAILNSANPLGTLISSQYIQVTPTAQYTGSQGVATQTSGTNTLVMVSDENYTDKTAFKTSMSGVQLVYELATSQTYQLTPVEVQTILGENNIFADCGDIENVTYRADTKLYIDNAIGGVDELLGSGVIE